jgi:hypothetical protein
MSTFGHNPGDREADAELRRLFRWKTSRPYTPHVLGEEAIELFNTQIKKRHAKFGKLSEVWDTLVPQLFQEHTMLASFVRGILTVHVDSSPYLYELKQLMLAGLEDQLLLACRGEGLKKVTLKRGKIDPGLPGARG